MNDTYRSPGEGRVDGIAVESTGPESSVDGGGITRDALENNNSTMGSSSSPSTQAQSDQPSKKRKIHSNDNDDESNNPNHYQDCTEQQQQLQLQQQQEVPETKTMTIAPSTDLWTRYDLNKEMTDDEMAELRVLEEQASLFFKPVKYNRRANGSSGITGRKFLLSTAFSEKTRAEEDRKREASGGHQDENNEEADHIDDDEEDWDRMFDRVVKYQKEHGHTGVPPPSLDNGTMDQDLDLAIWVQQQRQTYREVVVSKIRPPINELEAVRMERLEVFGFIWNYSEFAWQVQYHAIRKQLLSKTSPLWRNNKHDDSEPSQKGIVDDSPLLDSTMQDWIDTQRTYLDNGYGIGGSKLAKLKPLLSHYDRLRSPPGR